MKSRFHRSLNNKYLAGVCGGLAESFGISPLVFRVVFVILALWGGIGIIVYGILWFLMPEEKLQESQLSDQSLALLGLNAFTQAEPSAEAIEHYNRAIELWNSTAQNSRSDALRHDVCSQLALAIKKSNAAFPRAHSLLAMFLNELGDDRQAAEHATFALSQDPNEFRAQLVKIDVALHGVRVAKVGVGDWVTFDPQSYEKTIGETVGKTFGNLVAIRHSAMTQNSLKNEVVRLAQIFSNVCQENTDADEYLMMAETLIGLGDFIKDAPMPGGRPNLYAEIVNAPIDILEMKGKEEKVADVRRRAEGRSLLFRG